MEYMEVSLDSLDLRVKGILSSQAEGECALRRRPWPMLVFVRWLSPSSERSPGCPLVAASTPSRKAASPEGHPAAGQGCEGVLAPGSRLGVGAVELSGLRTLLRREASVCLPPSPVLGQCVVSLSPNPLVWVPAVSPRSAPGPWGRDRPWWLGSRAGERWLGVSGCSAPG